MNAIAAPTPIDRIHRVRIDLIDVVDRVRPLDPANVAVLMDSIAAQRTAGHSGLNHPITIRPAGERFRLALGGHRLDACKGLGDVEIDCIIRMWNDVEARLAELDENLARKLSKLDRAAHLAERDMLWKRLHPHLGKGRAGAKVRWHHATDKLSFASDVKDLVGLSDRQIRRDVRIWSRLDSAVRQRLAGTRFADHQVSLAALARLGPAVQVKVIDALLRPEKPATTVAAALAEVEGRRPPTADDDEKLFQRAMALWGRLCAAPKARNRFLDQLWEQGALDRYGPATPAKPKE
jgi:ParB family chromosome partitioning protein